MMWENRLDAITDRETGLSIRFIREWKPEPFVAPFDADALRASFQRLRDRRALPPDGPDIGADVPGGGAI